MDIRLVSYELYFNKVLTTFLGNDRGSSLAVYGGSESSRISSKNILICVLKMNEGLTGLERCELINDIILIFGWTVP